MNDGQPVLVDSHCHLDFPDFADDRYRVIERANAAGVGRMVSICTSLSQFDAVAKIAEEHDSVFFAAGTHPHKASSDTLASVDDLIALSEHPKMVGIGETGLDYHYTQETAESQKRSLEVHIEAARQTGLPLIIHSRDADRDMAEILTSEYRNGPFDCVMHCYSSGSELARKALELDFYLSMSGIVSFRSGENLRKIFAAAPIDRVLIETDAPYLAPVPHRGKRNEPAFVADTAKVGAEIFGIPYVEFTARTTANFDRLFCKAAVRAKP